MSRTVSRFGKIILGVYISVLLTSCNGCINNNEKQISKSIEDSCFIDSVTNEITISVLREKERSSKLINKEIILGFELRMSQSQYELKKQSLIRSGQLKKWSETTYYATLFCKEETVTQKGYGSFPVINYYDAELLWEPVFNNNQLTRWSIPVWYTIKTPDNDKNLKRYLDELYGSSIEENGVVYWIKGNREIRMVKKNVDKPPYGSEIIPVIEFIDNFE